MGQFDRPSRGELETVFGSNGVAGQRGEAAFKGLLRNARLPYQYWHSLDLPRTAQHQHPTKADLDFAMANGRRLALVDVKAWAGGFLRFSVPGLNMVAEVPTSGRRPANRATPLKLSASMSMARDRYREALPGIEIMAMVIFVRANGSPPPGNVSLLIWPGRIRSYKTGLGLTKIEDFLGSPEPIDPSLSLMLDRLKRKT